MDVVETIKNALDNMKGRRFFVSEADFQHAFAIELRETFKSDDARIYLEFPVRQKDKNVYIDILIEIAGRLFPIELKYKTKCIDDCYQPYENMPIEIQEILKNQSAQDLGCYHFWKDINRIETLIAENKVVAGVCIFITNDSYYWKGKCKETSQAWAFRVSDGLHNKGEYDWNTKHVDKIAKFISSNNGFRINNDYTFLWQKFHEIVTETGGSVKNGLFKYLFVEIPGKK